MRKYVLWFFAYTLPVFAAVPDNFPSALLYQDQPIDPLCFYQPESNQSTVYLDKCGLKIMPNQKISNHNAKLIKEGYVGADYVSEDAKGNTTYSAGYSYYKVIGKVGDNYVISTINSGGGSGEFAAVLLVKRTGDRLVLNGLAGGDRCNGGIASAKIEKSKLIYTVNMTPYDFLALAKQNPHNLTAYQDLAACAACCVATATFVRDLAIEGSQAKLISVRLNEDYSGFAQANASNAQACFDELVDEYIDTEKRNLTPEQLKQFVTEFNQRCEEKTT